MAYFCAIVLSVCLGYGLAKWLDQLRFWNWKFSIWAGWVGLALSFGYSLWVVGTTLAAGPDDAMSAVWGPIYIRLFSLYLGCQIVVAAVVASIHAKKSGTRFGEGFVSGFCDATVLFIIGQALFPVPDLALCVVAGWVGGKFTSLITSSKPRDL